MPEIYPEHTPVEINGRWGYRCGMTVFAAFRNAEVTEDIIKIHLATMHEEQA
jgi:hypothetical protein